MTRDGQHGPASARAFCEAELAAGQESMDVMQAMMDQYGLSHGVSKCVVLASEEFNAQFSFDLWQRLRQTSLTRQHLTKRFMRTFDLSGEETEWLLREFEAGNSDAMKQIRTFEQHAGRLVDGSVDELREVGIME